MEKIDIRLMEKHEKKDIKKLMNRSFPFFMRFFYSFTQYIIVAEKDGELIGGIILNMFNINKNRKAGLIAFIFSSPNYRGKKIGQKLVDKGIEFLKSESCSDVFSLVECDNTSSVKLFSTRDFVQLTPIEQFKRYGLKLFYIWFKIFHLFDIGHLLWVKSEDVIKIKKHNYLLLTYLSHILVALIAFFRAGYKIDLETISIIPLTYAVLLIFRMIPIKIYALYKKIELEYKVWETGILLSFLIAGIFRGLLPAPGSYIPKEKNWSYKNYAGFLGRASIISTLSLLLILSIFKLVDRSGLFIEYNRSFDRIQTITYSFIIFDILLPFFPFSPFNGKRIWKFNKSLWAVLASLTIILIVI